MKFSFDLFIFSLFCFAVLAVYPEQNRNPCVAGSCYPATGNLLIGRDDRLSATSTCGIYERTKYCIVSHLEDRKKCFWCDSTTPMIGRPTYEHRIYNIINSFSRGRSYGGRSRRDRAWWQSENGKQDVSIQLDLEAEFHFTHLIIKFRTFRPAAMLIERSYDYGKTWKVYRYFAHNCADSFPGVPDRPARKITDVICESRYSEVEPSSKGEVIFRVLHPNLQIDDPYSDEVQNLLKITNLRLNFTKLHTLGDQLLDTRPEIKEKYYYAIYDMIVRGSCSCYGHASRCLPLLGVKDKPDMVHGTCQCTHNTVGQNCEKCLDFYNDLPWKPAIGRESNACKRCECNDHATRCHFDPNIFEMTGRVSGGVCDECQHNTEGRNCESCAAYYYQDQTRSIQDPLICQPCKCDQRGTVDDGVCDSRTDVNAELVAGRCHCKQHVDGLKCDRCQPGYWNFTAEKPLGCQKCSCDLLGTMNNEGCDASTGMCQCKRNVVGRDCNQCRPQHYGLSEHPDGCQKCDCDRGGAFDDDCDVITGQCRCRPNVVGRRCERPREGYFVPYLNYLTLEAELAKGSENCQVVMRESHHDALEKSWSGIGFMRVFDESSLEFEVPSVETGMEYDLVIKYEPQFRDRWDGLKLRIERPDEIDPDGPCANSRPYGDIRTINHLSDRTHDHTVFPTICLESGKSYKIVLDFTRTNAYEDEPSASILIDAILLIPRAEQLPIYEGSLMKEKLKQEYEHEHCSEPFYTGHGINNLGGTCVENHLDSIGMYVFKQAYSCQCDGTGSRSSLCNEYGGQCDCKSNVEGRRCDRCAPGTYGFGPEGCSPCECNNFGSLDNFCDQQTGKCKCRPNTYGRQCNECQPGFWNFPNCQRCECNGHADTCDLQTGYCYECRDQTTGSNCAVCEEGFYGDPRLEVGIACRPCPCPGTVASRHSFASRCSLDNRTKDVVCECEEGYAGARCNVCADNYFGNPEVPGGQCEQCDCSNNIDISKPGNCDARSGKCLQCLFNTAGDRCEWCRDGFFGDAFTQSCRGCVCNLLGTNATSDPCDPLSGQCPCLPNVEGVECNKCIENHWKLASGVGCELCSCDNMGSFQEQCNEYDGQCSCKPGFGGRQCNQCRTNFYGNPRKQCLECNCNRDGSKSLQCDHKTGICDCLQGMGGDKCDQCARGYKGQAPYCEACGECFDNWDFILDGLKDRTRDLIENARNIKQRGATGAYKYEFENMEEMINDVRDLLFRANMTSKNLDILDGVIDDLRLELARKESDLNRFENLVDNTTQRISLASNRLAQLRLQADELKNQAGDLKDKATKLQEGNVEGALNLTRSAGEQSRQAEIDVEYTQVIVSESERYRKQTENIMIYKADRFNRTIQENERALMSIYGDLSAMEVTIPELNEQVCDGKGDPCDAFCGGAGCGKCGGLSCNDGLVNKANLALKFAEDTEKLIKKKEASADDLLRGISIAKQRSDTAHNLAFDLLRETMLALNSTNEFKQKIMQLLDEIQDFLDSHTASPENIKKLVEEILALRIKLKPEQITELADKITLTIQSLTDIDAIIEATKYDLARANDLKDLADRVKARAEDTLAVAQRVSEALEEAADAQNKAESAINGAETDIKATEGYLEQIAAETASAQALANSSRKSVLLLENRVDKVQGSFKTNEKHLEDTKRAVDEAAQRAQRTAIEAKELQDKYNQIENQLEEKSKYVEEARKRADDLKRHANKLSAEIGGKLDFLKDLEATFKENEITIDFYEGDIGELEERMREYHEYILKKATFYATCTGATT